MRSGITLVSRLSLILATLLFSANTFAQAPAPQETPPPPAAPRSVQIPKPVEQTLSNGLRVIVIEDHDMPLISAQLLVKNGGEIDPPTLSGLADMTASLLTKGTKTRTAPEIAQQIEALGGTINSGAGWDASRASVNVMSSKIAPAMAILADVVRNPVFQDEEIERLRQQNLDGLSVSMNDPGTLASWVAARVVFADSPYGHPVSGTTSSLTQLKRDDIVKLHSTYYRPDNSVLVIGGDIKAAEAFKLATTVFGDWKKPAGAIPTSIAKGGNGSAKPRVVVVDMPAAGQAAVVLARTGISRNDPDYYRGIVTNAVLTGYSGRLNQEIRIKRGLSYGAGSNLDARRETGPFVAVAQTKNPSGAEVASLLVTELTRLSSEPMPETELVPRKAVLIGGFGRALETTDGLVGQIAALALHGLSLDQINSYIGNVQAIKPNDIQKFASSRLDPKGANIIIVGNAKEFLPELQKRYADIEVIAATDLDLNNATLKKVATSSGG
jgi:zinc protease